MKCTYYIIASNIGRGKITFVFLVDVGLSLIKDPKSFCRQICDEDKDDGELVSPHDMKMTSTYADIGSNNANPNPGNCDIPF